MASRRRLQEFLSFYMQHYMRMKQMERQSQLTGQRQLELADTQARNAALNKLLADPHAAARYAQLNPNANLGGVPLETFVPTHEQALGEAQTELGKVNALDEVPTDLDLEGSFFARPGAQRDPRAIEALIAQRNARRDHLGRVNPIRVDSAYNELGGNEETQFLDPLSREVQSRVVTGPTPQQAGLDEGAQELAKLQTPGLTEAQIATSNQIEAGTRNEKAKTAGAVSGAQEDAQIRARLAHAQELLDQKIKEAEALLPFELDRERQVGQVKALANLRQTSANALNRLAQLELLWKQAEPKIREMAVVRMVPGNLGTTILDRAMPYAGMPKEVRLYYQQLQATLPFLARAAGDVGNLAIQEQLQQLFAAPAAMDAVEETGLEKLQRMQAAMLALPDLMQVDPSLEPGDALNEMERIIEEAKQSIAGRAGRVRLRVDPNTGQVIFSGSGTTQ